MTFLFPLVWLSLPTLQSLSRHIGGKVMGLAIWHSELTDYESPREFAPDDVFVEAPSEDPPVLFFDVTIVLVLP
jgi:hypothetical protein